MRIVSLELENTKSYQTSRIDFTDGVNAIVGHNGAGKSTILEAIGFALFDSLNGYKHSDFVREGVKSATIIVTFVSNLDERQYQVTLEALVCCHPQAVEESGVPVGTIPEWP